MSNEKTSPPPNRLNYCDVVMKGGITSGVVYPRVVTEIAKSFALRSVGGTSAGAIAAAAAAAAARQASARYATPSRAGFDELEKLPDFLSTKNVSGHTNLFTFFQPQAKTSKFFTVCTAALNAKGEESSTKAKSAAGGVLAVALREFWGAFLLGAMPGLILLVLVWYHGISVLSVAAALAGIVLALIGGFGALLWAFLAGFGEAVPDNFYGLCSGMAGSVAKDGSSGGESKPAIPLTEWLTGYLSKLAGVENSTVPLLFGQLWDPTWVPDNSEGKLPSGAVVKSEREVNLEMMTTCVTWSRPFRLPFQDEEDVRENVFFFRESEFREFFPKEVVDWLVKHERASEGDPAKAKLPGRWRELGFRALPDPWNLPVIVATRMSLSFPILLSAVPLYAYNQDASDEEREAAQPERCWFSDGGICSNFPMHFFDSPLPRWPTLAIDLVPKPETADAATMERGWMPETNGQGLRESWSRFDQGQGLGRVLGFVGTIMGTMQNWSDNTLARMPGYRDRVSHVPLKPSEGGLNLDMPEDLIMTLGKRGEKTGEQFVERFARGNHKMNWENHRWLRLRAALASLEQMLTRLEAGCVFPPTAGPTYDDWLMPAKHGTEPSYKMTNLAQRKLAWETLEALRAIAQKLNAAAQTGTPLEAKSPHPRPELRPRPRI